MRTARAQDVEPFRRAVLASAERMRRWNPVNPDDLPQHLAAQSIDHRTFLVLANRSEQGQPVVGRVNLNGVVRGRFRSVAIGYDAYDPYAGRGMFSEGLRLIVDLAFASIEAGGMDLHRVEASVQPGNAQSAGLLRSLGFRHEGFSPRMLFLPGDNGQERWRDHDRYAITAEEWPARPYPTPQRDRMVVLLDTHEVAGGIALARAVSRELGIPLVPVGLAPVGELKALVADCPSGAALSGPLSRADHDQILTGLSAAFPLAPLVSLAGTEPLPNGRAVTRLALELRAAARTGT